MLLHLHFSGGLELLFGNEKQKEVQVPCTSQASQSTPIMPPFA